MNAEVAGTSAGACNNCQAPLASAQQFCGACGQRAPTNRLTLHDIGHDLLHAVTHADHSVLSLVAELAINPGNVARDFVSGRRKRHFGPFAFLFIAVAVTTAIVLITGMNWFIGLNGNPAGQFMQHHLNLVILVQVPILAGSCAILFRNSRLNYAEHLILVTYTSGFRVLVMGLIGAPLWFFVKPYVPAAAALVVYYALWFSYFCWAASQFYGGNRKWNAAKAFLAALITQAAAVGLISEFASLVD